MNPSIPSEMQAVVIDAFGPPQALRLAAVPVPKPGHGEVLVRTRFAGVNPIDAKTRAGYGVTVSRFPAILGWDLSGVVVGVGPGVANLREGDGVFGMSRFPQLAGAYAEYVAAPASELTRKPENVDERTAAAAPMVALTAWQSLFALAHLTSGQRVLIHGASGGVGHVAVQLARWTGAEVIGTASARNHEFVTQLGARSMVDYTKTPLETAARDIDVVLDTRGGEDFMRLLNVLRPGGIIVSLVGRHAAGEKAVAAKGMRSAFTWVRPEPTALERVAQLLADGTLRIAIDRVLPFGDVATAHTLIESGHMRGRLLLDMMNQ
jgi:NADPH:quinone reductase-like Zn-dependent oxidoreductase